MCVCVNGGIIPKKDAMRVIDKPYKKQIIRTIELAIKDQKLKLI